MQSESTTVDDIFTVNVNQCNPAAMIVSLLGWPRTNQRSILLPPIQLPSLVDTGSGRSYFLLHSQNRGIHKRIANRKADDEILRVVVANGDTQETSGAFYVDIGVVSTEGKQDNTPRLTVRMHTLSVVGPPTTMIIIGRDLLLAMSARIDSSGVYMYGINVYTTDKSNDICAVDDSLKQRACRNVESNHDTESNLDMNLAIGSPGSGGRALDIKKGLPSTTESGCHANHESDGLPSTSNNDTSLPAVVGVLEQPMPLGSLEHKERIDSRNSFVVSSDETAALLGDDEYDEPDINPFLRLDVYSKASTSYMWPYSDEDNIPLDKWVEVKRTRGYRTRRRMITHSESKDTNEQVELIEFDWDDQDIQAPESNTVTPHDYSRKMVQVLSEPHRILFNEQIQKYIDKGWWTRTETGSQRNGIPAICFPIIADNHKSTKVRPVVDMRATNRTLPAASYQGSDCGDLLRTIRFIIPVIAQSAAKSKWNNPNPERMMLATLDMATAFYRLHLHGRTVPILSNGVTYSSSRVVFGSVYGPSMLETACRYLLWKTGELVLSAVNIDNPELTSLEGLIWSSYYLDDITIFGSAGIVELFIQNLTQLGSITGFDFPMEKRNKCYLKWDGDKGCVAMSTIEPFKHLGHMFVSKEGEPLIVQCLHRDAPPIQDDRLTKRKMFQHAGLSYDPLMTHSSRSLAGDIIRGVAGREQHWDSIIKLTDIQKKDLRTLYPILVNKSCDHPILSKPPRAVAMFTDASSSGYGFTIQAESTALMERARVWRGPEAVWHINRRELFATAAAISALDNYIHMFEGAVVSIFGDSKTAMAWLSAGGDASTKSLERTAIRRIVGIIEEILTRWRKEHSIQIRWHRIDTSQNIADPLSRLTDIWNISPQLSQGNNTRMDANVNLIASIKEIGMPLAERVSSLSRDIDEALDMFESVYLIFYTWKNKFNEVDRPDMNTIKSRFAHSCQSLAEIRPPAYMTPTPAGPVIADIADRGVLKYIRPLPVGGHYYQLVIPSSCEQAQRVIFTKYHYECRHANAEQTLHHMRDWYLVRGMSYVKRQVRLCILCQRKNAKRMWSLTPDVHVRDPLMPSYADISCDLLSLGDKRQALSIYCNTSQHVSFSILNQPNTESIYVALRRLTMRYGQWPPAFIHTDNHSVFKCLEGRLPTTKFTYIPPYHHEANPVERIHRELLASLRTPLLRLKLESLTDMEIQDHLDDCTLFVNYRPLATFRRSDNYDREGSVITPWLLCIGKINISAEDCLRGHLYDVRRIYFDIYWRQLKQRARNSLPLYRKLRRRLLVGDYCLLYKPSSKLQWPWIVGEIVNIVNSKVTVRTGASTRICGANDVIPLELSEPSTALPDRCGQRVISTVDGVNYAGTIIVDEGQRQLIDYDPVGDKRWEPEWKWIDETLPDSDEVGE